MEGYEVKKELSSGYMCYDYCKHFASTGQSSESGVRNTLVGLERATALLVLSFLYCMGNVQLNWFYALLKIV
jgi:hypothetical protein